MLRTFQLLVAVNLDDSHWTDGHWVSVDSILVDKPELTFNEAWKVAADYFRSKFPTIMNLFGNGRIAIVRRDN